MKTLSLCVFLFLTLSFSHSLIQSLLTISLPPFLSSFLLCRGSLDLSQFFLVVLSCFSVLLSQKKPFPRCSFSIVDIIVCRTVEWVTYLLLALIHSVILGYNSLKQNNTGIDMGKVGLLLQQAPENVHTALELSTNWESLEKARESRHCWEQQLRLLYGIGEEKDWRPHLYLPRL